jgi:pilus biogenesis lipoprotein CpaD
MTKRNNIFALLALAMLPACADMDMQGTDPNDYFAKHPIVNKVEHKSANALLRFNGSAIDSADLDALHKTLKDVHPEGIDSISAEVGLVDTARKVAVARALAHEGIYTPVSYNASESVASNEALLEIDFASVIAPECPGWKLSPNHTFSNTSQGNFGCASATNLGAMIADPHDLEQGRGGGTPDSTHAARAIENYRNGAISAGGSAPPVGSSSNATPTTTTSTTTTSGGSGQ